MKNLVTFYEQIRPMIIWLGLLEIAWIGYWLVADMQRNDPLTQNIVFWIVAMLIWMALVIWLAKKGVYLRYSYLFSNLIGFAAVIIFPVLLFAHSEMARAYLIQVVIRVSDFQLIGFHALRLLAIGTIIKYWQRQLPLHFLLLGSLPDFMFALSAVTLLWFDSDVSYGNFFYLVWHSIGIAVFLGAGISMFLSVPSIIRIYHDKPDTKLIFSFPMVLAPNVTVPLFVVAHLLAIFKITMGGEPS